MSAFITSPTTELPLQGAATANRSGLTSTFRRRASQFLLAATSASLFAAPTFSADVYPVEGYWLSKDGASIVEIAPCTDSHKRLCGTVVWADGGEVGSKIMTSFRLSGNKAGDKWAKGKIALNGGKAKSGKLAVNGDKLKVSTCKGTSRCKSSTWSRPSATMTAQAGLGNGAE
ncbi:MAG: DUF2147 domain-containing protein [Proteobacteria bacterium]|nr:DUF2147 domain-containing protein [Pseudomonadota bacterium]